MPACLHKSVQKGECWKKDKKSYKNCKKGVDKWGWWWYDSKAVAENSTR